MLVKNNFIGSDGAGAVAIPNVADGIFVEMNAPKNTIGGPAFPDDNLIAFNGGNGVNIASGNGNRIQQNAIFLNTKLGIDLGNNGVTRNTSGGPHNGANHLQNFPVITSALFLGTATSISINLNSTPSSTFTIELFSSPVADPSGFGEGKTFLAAFNVKTDTHGGVNKSISLTGVPAGTILTATASDVGKNPNDTSEFSAAVKVTVPPPLTVNDLNFTTANGKLTGVVLTFSQKLNSASVSKAGNLGLFSAGPDQVFGTADDTAIKTSSIKYDATKKTVTLTTSKPLAANKFIEVFAGGTGAHVVTSASGLALDGEFTETLPSGNSKAGGDFRAVVANGTSLTYKDGGGDSVSLSLAHATSMTLLRTLDGEGRLLTLLGTSKSSVLSGNVVAGTPAPPADGMTTLQSIKGLGAGKNNLPASFVIL